MIKIIDPHDWVVNFVAWYRTKLDNSYYFVVLLKVKFKYRVYYKHYFTSLIIV